MEKQLTIKLNDGIEMPMLGYGVFQVSQDDCERCVIDALETGYRLIDTAQVYGNEEQVGNAILKSGIKREDIFLVTKVWISNSGYEKAKQSIENSLKLLKTDYVDLLLIHQPFGDYYGTYRALIDAKKAGKTRSIGVSNFYEDRFTDLVMNFEEKPSVNQCETHVFYQRKALKSLMSEYGTKLMSWGPFAEGKNDFFKNQTLVDIGYKYMKTPAQVALRFLLQEGIIVIPKSVHKNRMIENFSVDDFYLADEDVNTLRNLDFNRTLFTSHYDPDFAKTLINIKV